MTVADTLEAARSWSSEERLELALGLWDSLTDEDWLPEPDEELIRELERRLAAHEKNPQDVRSGEQVWARFGLQP